ncbi:MAG TPA: ferrous iron transport protein B [Candidatus Methanomethylophilaceae archaeon]|nr:ferrous iron transport protein B [Candidatus Methanomethylophilaceae archaeon]
MQDGMFTAALVGQPNVGKSSLFSRLTGVGVISSNYAGTTVEIDEAVIVRKGNKVRIYDLPGTYSMSGNSDDENVVLKMVKNPDIDSIIVVADATNLQSSLVLCMEVIELGLPIILAINKVDEAYKKFDTDFKALEKILGVSVIPVSAKTSEGVDALADAVCDGLGKKSLFKVLYNDNLESAISKLIPLLGSTRFDSRGTAVKLMEGTKSFVDDVDADVANIAVKIRDAYELDHDESSDVAIARDRYSFSDATVRKIQFRDTSAMTRKDKLSEILITPSTGIPILIGVMLTIFLAIIYVGSFLDEIVESTYEFLVGNTLIDFGLNHGGELGETIMKGINGSILAIFTLVIPYILVFYIMLGILEDTGYLPRAVVLLDRTMHRFGLHGGAFIPMMVGLGCNVPAIMATRSIQSRREKIIVTTLIVICVPCSAQLAIIFGIVGQYSGVLYSFAILAVVLALMFVMGLTINRLLKKEPSNLAMEIPDLEWPTAKNVLFKTWDRIKDFFYIAFPLIVVGSILLEIALNYNLLDFIINPFSFLTVVMLGLPASLIIAFIAGVLRKEMALAMLVAIAGTVTLSDFMTPDQFFIFGLIMAIYMPCLATVAVMWREIGWKETIVVSALSVGTAIAIGSIANLLLTIF